jgi:hypothetical protein
LININTLEHTPELFLGPAGTVEIVIHGVNLRPGTYKLGFWLGASQSKHVDVVTDHTILEVLAPVGSKWFTQHDGVLRCPFEFKLN